jgi:hypothetical protein
MILDMNIKKRLSLAQMKRQALMKAGIAPSSYGEKKRTQVVLSKKTKASSRKQKHKHLHNLH